MKKLNLLTIFIMLAFASVSFGQNIANSAHDFSALGWSNGQICQPCHTPHNAVAGEEPLWSHDLSSNTYNVYSSSTLDAGALGQPDGHSKLCLSCHDGTVALDNYVGSTPTATFISTNNNIGGPAPGQNLMNDHPISFVYDNTLATTDTELHDPSTLSADVKLDGNDKMQCSTCHDVHRKVIRPNLLVMSNAGSLLCLECHDK